MFHQYYENPGLECQIVREVYEACGLWHVVEVGVSFFSFTNCFKYKLLGVVRINPMKLTVLKSNKRSTTS